MVGTLFSKAQTAVPRHPSTRRVVTKTAAPGYAGSLVINLHHAQSCGTSKKGTLLLFIPAWNLTIPQHVDEFIYRISEEELDRTKRRKLQALKLEPEEWDRVEKCLDLLSVRIHDK